MNLTKERLLALITVVANGILGACLGHFSQSYATEAGVAILLSIPGLIIIWFRESLGQGELAFPRGIPRPSPPAILAVIGWFFLLLIPALYIYELSQH